VSIVTLAADHERLCLAHPALDARPVMKAIAGDDRRQQEYAALVAITRRAPERNR
jgi:hypothetical protein